MMNFEWFKQICNNFNIVNINRDDNIKMKGIFELQTYTNNKIVDDIKKQNIIVGTSFDILKNLLVDGDVDYRINTLKLGDGGIYNSNIKEALVTENDLYSPLESKVIPAIYTSADVLLDIASRSIKYTWIFDENEGNGAGARIYNEAGLFSNNLTMFSKKNFSEVVKTADKKMIISWTIKF